MKISLHKEWTYTSQQNVTGILQSDRTDHVAFFDEMGGVFVLSSKGELLLDIFFAGGVVAVRLIKMGAVLVVLDQQGKLHCVSLDRENRGKILWTKFVILEPICMDARANGQGFCVGTQQGLITFLDFKGDRKQAVYVDHAVHFVKYAHDVPSLVCAAEIGQVSFFGEDGKFAWMLDMQSPCTGIDVNTDASLILLPSLNEGIHAYSKNREALGVYEVGGEIDRAVLAQKGDRLLVSNREGRLHIVDQAGNLMVHFDLKKRIQRMDLNYSGTRVVIQQEPREVVGFSLVDAGMHHAQFVDLRPESDQKEKGPQSPQVDWVKEVVGLKRGKIAVSAQGQFSILLTDFQRLISFNERGDTLWEEALDPRYSFDMHLARLGNLVVVWCEEFVDLFTCQNGRLKRFQSLVQSVSVHEGGLFFALLTRENKLGFFDKKGQCLWSQTLDEAVREMRINPKGNAVFVLFQSGSLRVFDDKGTMTTEVFKPTDQTKVSMFTLDRTGMTCVSADQVFFRLTPDGKTPWRLPFSEVIDQVQCHRGDVFSVWLQNGQVFFVNKQGDILCQRAGEKDSRQRVYWACDQSHIFEISIREKYVECHDLISKKNLWDLALAEEIYQLDLDSSGVKMVCICDGELVSVPLLPAEGFLPERVTFLEF